MIGVEENPYQKAFYYSPKFESSGWGGVGSGKSAIGIRRSFAQMWGFPEGLWLVGRKTATSLRDTTQKQFLNYIREMNGGTLEPGPVVKQWKIGDKDLILRQDSVVMFRHLDDIERILSMELAGIFIDQVEELPWETYKQVKGRLRQWGPANVEMWRKKWADFSAKFFGHRRDPRHYLNAVGNPHPGWAKTYFKERKDPDTNDPLPSNDMFGFFDIPTKANSKNLPLEYLKSLETSTGAWRKRFYLGDWDTMEGQVYTELTRMTHICAAFKIPEHWPRTLGMDHGFTNPTVCLAVASDEHGNHFVYREYYKEGEVVEEHAKAIKKKMAGDPVKNDLGNICLWGDPSMKGAGKGIVSHGVIEEYQKHGITVWMADNAVLDGIMRLAELIKVDPDHVHPLTGKKGAPHLYFLEDAAPYTFQEMIGLEWEPPKPGMNKSERPKKKADHGPDALRYLVMAIFHKAPKIVEVVTSGDDYDDYLARELQKVDVRKTPGDDLVRYGD